MRTVIINGTVVTADQTVEADVLIEGDKIMAIARGRFAQLGGGCL